jgi:hypothetical protein
MSAEAVAAAIAPSLQRYLFEAPAGSGEARRHTPGGTQAVETATAATPSPPSTRMAQVCTRSLAQGAHGAKPGAAARAAQPPNSRGFLQLATAGRVPKQGLDTL